MVAVIIPCYNRPDCLAYALKTLTMQSDRKFVTIVVDDCSEEDMKSVCDSFRNELMLVYLRLDKNSGPGVARQAGIDYAAEMKWEYVMFLDSDDGLMPNAVEKLAYEIKHRGDDFVFSTISVQDKNAPGYLIEPEKGLRVWMHGKIFRTSFLVENGIRFEDDLRGNEDVNFMIKCSIISNKSSYIQDATYFWKCADNSITRQNGLAKNGVLSRDYITAVCKAFLFLDRKGIKLDKELVAYCFYCYNYYQVSKYFKYDLTETDKLLEEFFKIELFRKAFIRSKTWDKGVDSINQYKVIDKKIVWFQEDFCTWIRRYGIDSDNVKI